MKSALTAVAVMALAALTAIPAAAAAPRTPSCTRIRESLASGKSVEEVAKEMKVAATTVRHCQAPPTRRQAKATGAGKHD